MKRIITLAAAITSSVMLLSATAGHAQPTGGYYNATLAAAPSKASFITSGTLWKCGDTACVANKATQRDLIMCQMVAQRAGQLTAFAVAGTPVDADTLAKCNKAAK